LKRIVTFNKVLHIRNGTVVPIYGNVPAVKDTTHYKLNYRYKQYLNIDYVDLLTVHKFHLRL